MEGSVEGLDVKLDHVLYLVVSQKSITRSIEDEYENEDATILTSSHELAWDFDENPYWKVVQEKKNKKLHTKLQVGAFGVWWWSWSRSIHRKNG